jgi:hypothetical protein
MNFYGDSFHVAKQGNNNYQYYNYTWSYGPANPSRMVVNTARVNSELSKTYQPLQVNLGALRWSRLSEQIFRVDKWSACRG